MSTSVIPSTLGEVHNFSFVICFVILAFTYKFDFLPFMVLIIALLNDGTIMTLLVDRVLPSSTLDSWNLGEIYVSAVA